VPRREDYAYRLWDYRERHLDPELFIDRSLAGAVKNKVVLVTGASSGIGKATALKIAAAGGKVIVVARGDELLDALVRQLVAEHGGVDILANNAGRSIRRAIENSFERFHDFQRCMQLNYFGALRLTLSLLPGMVKRHSGHVINVSSIGVLTNASRFSAYVASKAAMDAFARCAVSTS